MKSFIVNLTIIYFVTIIFADCKSKQIKNKPVNQEDTFGNYKNSHDSIFELIDKDIYLYKNIAFCDMLSIGNQGCSLNDNSSSVLHAYFPTAGEEALNIRAFNDSIIRKQRYNPNKYQPDTLRASMFMTGLELYKSNVYDSMALIAIAPFYPKNIIEEYKKEDRREKRNSFEWVVPPSR